MSLQRRGDFLDMGERLADLVAAGDHDAAGIEDPEAGERDLLRFQDDRHQPRADLDIGRRRRRARWKRVRPPPQQVVAGGEVERRPDRRQLVFAIRARFGRNFRAERDAGGEAGLHFARIDRRQHAALRDQFGLGLVDELVVVEAEEEQSDQRQRRHGGEHGENDQSQ